MMKTRKMKLKDIVLVSGGFDPLHNGHIQLFKSAATLGHELVVGLNSDEWLVRKKGKAFLAFEERKTIVESIGCVDYVWAFDDSDDTADRFLKNARGHWPENIIIFANGGDRNQLSTPEDCEIYDIIPQYNIGGQKSNSSSTILKEWTANKTKRKWGSYLELHEDDRVKVKELTIKPFSGISYQRHFLRSEIWFVSHGKCTVRHSQGTATSYTMHNLREDDVFTVRANEWHQIDNPYSEPCKIIEIQYGEETDEDDIERYVYGSGPI